ncbi:MAG: trypsin-like peptidase domain-containing protein, partial [Pseudomonadales bacterium]|nr:trypsin-like peptidase domain-containing protein [Pseudomonadales bacterium]
MNQFKFILLAIGFGFLVGILAATWQPFTAIFSTHHEPDSLADAAASAAPSVVNIFTSTINPIPTNQQSNITSSKRQLRKGISLGSGVIVDSSGLIMTNLHVLKQASAIQVQLHDGRHMRASIVGIDEATDLALLKIDMTNLPSIAIGNSDIMRVGDNVLAIGNPFGFGQTVTQGIISAKGRYGLNLNTYENFIQTDAAVNTGSSGGALIDSQGQL